MAESIQDPIVGLFVFSDHILAPDRMTRISGSVKLDRDLRRDLKKLDPNGDAELRKLNQRSNIIEIPVGKHWCSHPDHEGWDDNGKDDKGWRPVSEFYQYIDTNGKKRYHEHCNTCRARHRRRMYALQKEAQGKTVRTYNRKSVGRAIPA